MKITKRILTVCMALFMAFTLSSCSVLNLVSLLLGMFQNTQISLEYTLTEDDLTEFAQMAQECEEIALEGTNVLSLTLSLNDMMTKMEYIDAQATVGYLEYCQDQTSATALEHYTQSEAIMAEARLIYLDLLKTLATDSPLKDDLFGDWTEEDLAMLYVDNDLISQLQLANSEITREFYALEENEQWSANVSQLYHEFVENNQAMAIAYGKKNYYELASSDLAYGRNYTAEDRAAFRGYVASYVLPLYQEVYEESTACYEALSETQKLEYQLISSNSNYLYNYMDTYEGTLNEKMYAMFQLPNASIFASGENALQGAFVTYISYYQQPIAYFGPSYQDLLTVTHELGHYASLYYFDQSVMPYDLAETHSQGNEWMLLAYLEQEEIDPEVYRAFYLQRALAGLVTVIYATVVDHFEEIVYTTDTAAEHYELVMTAICEQYAGLDKLVEQSVRYTPFEYAQRVTISAPGYYLNYATSEIASMSLYVIAQEEGYAAAQTAYTLLQEGVDPEGNFQSAIEEAGLLSPFAEQTYIDLKNVFMPTKTDTDVNSGANSGILL